MFKKQQVQEDEKMTTIEGVRSIDNNRADEQTGKNTILKGSKLIGDISVTCDLELDGDVEGNIGGLGDDCNTAFNRLATMLVGPQGTTIKIVDEAVAIWSKQSHFAGGFE